MQEKYGEGTRSAYVRQLETVQMTAATKILIIACSNTKSNTAVLRAKLGMHPLETNRDVKS